VQVSRITRATGRPSRKVTSLSVRQRIRRRSLHQPSGYKLDCPCFPGRCQSDPFFSLLAAKYRRALEGPATSSFLIKSTCQTEWLRSACRCFRGRRWPAAFPQPSMTMVMMWHQRTDTDPGACAFRNVAADAVAAPRLGAIN
jgi:hypothetical protein